MRSNWFVSFMVVLCIKLIVCENETVTLVSNETTTTEAITSTSIPNTETTIANKDVIEPEVHPEVKAENQSELASKLRRSTTGDIYPSIYNRPVIFPVSNHELVNYSKRPRSAIDPPQQYTPIPCCSCQCSQVQQPVANYEPPTTTYSPPVNAKPVPIYNSPAIAVKPQPPASYSQYAADKPPPTNYNPPATEKPLINYAPPANSKPQPSPPASYSPTASYSPPIQYKSPTNQWVNYPQQPSAPIYYHPVRLPSNYPQPNYQSHFYRSADNEWEDSLSDEARSAYPAYAPPQSYSSPQPAAAPYTYPSPAPKTNCGSNLLIGCAPSVAQVPCSSYSAPPPAY